MTPTLLREAATWRLLGRLFECPTAGWHEDIQRLAGELGDPELQAAVASAAREATEGQYHSVFGPGGPAPPREVSYHDTLELGSVMSSVAAFYHAFGYEPETQETLDHVAVEAGFMAYLRLKQAYALAGGDQEAATVTAEAAGEFCRSHLAVVAGRLRDLLAASHLDYLRRASAALVEKTGRPPGPRRLPLVTVPPDEDGSEFACS
ncbi:MAG: molecular chaperone TorD family protein [Acidobacteriota bacterium]